GFLIRHSIVPQEYYYRQSERADRLENGQKQAKEKLWELRETGVALRNNGRELRDEAEVAEWTKEFEAWYKALLENASIYSSDLRHALDPLDKIALENRELVKAPHVNALGARLPTIHAFRDFVGAGGLMSYGPNNADLFRRAGDIVDKILKGAKPADLPVEQPTKFELVINLTTAKALGFTIPEAFLLRAGELIE